MKFELLASKLALVADANGMWEHDVARFPELLKRVRLKPSSITPAVIDRARAINRDASRALLDRHNRPATAKCDESKANTPDKRATKRATKREKRTKSVYCSRIGCSFSDLVAWMSFDFWSLDDAIRVLSKLNMENRTDEVCRVMTAARDSAKFPPHLTDDQSNYLYGLAESE